MKSTDVNPRGFTLIELLIVVSIIGILAAIVIPQFADASDRAKSGSVMSQINTAKKSLILYHTDHNDTYPTADQMITNPWQAMINSTDVTGDIAGTDYGPYFMKPPTNAFIGSSAIAADSSAAWQYDPADGTIQAVVPQALIDRAEALNLNPDDLVAAP